MSTQDEISKATDNVREYYHRLRMMEIMVESAHYNPLQMDDI